MKAQVQFHFEIDDLYVDAALLGSTYSIQRGEFAVHFKLPATEQDFGTSLEDWGLALGGGMQRGDAWVSRAVLLVRVSVDLDLPDSARDDSPDRSTIDDVNKRLAPAAAVARAVVYEYVALVRTRHGQHWLSHSAEMPKLCWLTNVIDRELGRHIRIGYNDPIKMRMMVNQKALSVSEHEKLLMAVEQRTASELPDLLLADAYYLAGPSDPPQYRESILLAAIAAEVKIKESLDLACLEASREILNFALRNPRDVSVQAASLYDKAAQAVTGRSLRIEDRDAYKDLEQLFQDRNSIAHRARSIGQAEVRRGLKAATRALEWAASLVPRAIDNE